MMNHTKARYTLDIQEKYRQQILRTTKHNFLIQKSFEEMDKKEIVQRKEK